MTTKDLLLLLLGAIVGAVVSGWYVATTGVARRRIKAWTVQRWQREGASAQLAVKTVAYYQARRAASSLYTPTTLSDAQPIPLLFDSKVRFPRDVEIHRDLFLTFDHSWTKFPYSRRAIRWYNRRGAAVFDGEPLCLKAVSHNPSGLMQLTVGRSNFYAHASLAFKLRREMLSPMRRPRLHDHFLQTFEEGLLSDLQPKGISCATATLFQGPHTLQIAVSRRSNTVMTSHGVFAVLPAFSMEANAIGETSSNFGITFYNFVREFCEELFDLEQLVHVQTARRADPDWIFEIPVAAAVLREAEAGRFCFFRSGVALNPSTGGIRCALVAHFTSHDFFRWVQKELKINWESTRTNEVDSPISFLELDDPRISLWARDYAMTPTSIFCVDLARRYAAELTNQGSMKHE
jgi:hypothetical protein